MITESKKFREATKGNPFHFMDNGLVLTIMDGSPSSKKKVEQDFMLYGDVDQIVLGLATHAHRHLAFKTVLIKALAACQQFENSEFVK